MKPPSVTRPRARAHSLIGFVVTGYLTLRTALHCFLLATTRVLPSHAFSLTQIGHRAAARRRDLWCRPSYRQSQFTGLTRLQLDEVGRERQVQQQGRQRAEALAERSVEIAQAMVMVPLAGALARGGG